MLAVVSSLWDGALVVGGSLLAGLGAGKARSASIDHRVVIASYSIRAWLR